MDLIDVSTRVGWPVYAGWALLSGLLVWVLIAPDAWWRRERALVGWQYRDGHRIELSTAGRIWVRFWAAVVLVVLAVGAGATVNWTAVSRVETEWRSGETVYDVGDPVESPGCTVRVVACLRSDAVFPIPVTRYAVRDGAALRLYVERRFFPTHLVLDEGERVTVAVYGRCAARAPGEPYGRSASDCVAESLPGFGGVVPVRLDGPLDGRTVIDGTRDAPVRPAR